MLKKLNATDNAQKRKAPAQASTNFNGNTKLDVKDPSQSNKEKEKKDVDVSQKDLTSEEILTMTVEIKPIEKKALDKVFKRLCRATPSFEEDANTSSADYIKDYFTAEDLVKVLAELRHVAGRPEVDLMIWVKQAGFCLICQEVDENLDRKVDRNEFDLMFRRCIEDKTGLEPKNLFNLVQFLMYCQEDSIEIIEEDTLELIFVRVGSIPALEEAIKIIFG